MRDLPQPMSYGLRPRKLNLVKKLPNLILNIIKYGIILFFLSWVLFEVLDIYPGHDRAFTEENYPKFVKKIFNKNSDDDNSNNNNNNRNN